MNLNEAFSSCILKISFIKYRGVSLNLDFNVTLEKIYNLNMIQKLKIFKVTFLKFIFSYFSKFSIFLMNLYIKSQVKK